MLTDQDTLLSRDIQRPIDCQMHKRCITLLNNFKNKSYNNKNILDTTDLSISQTVEIIKNNNNFIL